MIEDMSSFEYDDDDDLDETSVDSDSTTMSLCKLSLLLYIAWPKALVLKNGRVTIIFYSLF